MGWRAAAARDPPGQELGHKRPDPPRSMGPQQIGGTAVRAEVWRTCGGPTRARVRRTSGTKTSGTTWAVGARMAWPPEKCRESPGTPAPGRGLSGDALEP